MRLRPGETCGEGKKHDEGAGGSPGPLLLHASAPTGNGRTSQIRCFALV